MVEGTGATLGTGQCSHPGAALGWAGDHLTITLLSPYHHLAITCVQEAELGREEQTQAPNTLQSPARASVLVSLSVKL